VHPSAFEPQGLQASPLSPQAVVDPGAMQVLSGWQQPPSQLEALHTHWPPWQVWPLRQPASPPQVHVPSAHPSPSNPQVMQAVPAMPQAVLLGTVQVPPWQQPPSQLSELQPLQLPLQV
jgi:hypothetical protein